MKNSDRNAPAQPWGVERVLVIDQLSLFLAVSRRTLERMIATGEFPACDFRIRSRPVWRSSSVQAWIEAQPETQGRSRRHGS